MSRKSISRTSMPATLVSSRHRRLGKVTLAHATLGLLLVALVLATAPAVAAPSAGVGPVLQTQEAATPAGVVNINSASIEQLQLLPRIGPTVAKRIVEFREQNGRFENPEDLLLIEGIGDRTFEQLERWIRIDGETTLNEKVRTARPARAADSDESESARSRPDAR